jgi:SAM-dependent methyltransferase
VIWHDLECGRYRADLPLWRELAATQCGGAGAELLDLGAGSGRVALDLARAGHAVTALDIDAALLAELSRRAGELPIRPVLADATSFELERRDHCLCLVPMQTIQLLAGAAERRALLARARAHLRAGALMACAIVTEVDEFDATRGGLGPSPERARVAGALYVSRAIRLAVGPESIRIERERFADSGPVETNVVELQRVTARTLLEDGQAAGLRPEPTHTIKETEEHAGSEVVVMRA